MWNRIISTEINIRITVPGHIIFYYYFFLIREMLPSTVFHSIFASTHKPPPNNQSLFKLSYKYYFNIEFFKILFVRNVTFFIHASQKIKATKKLKAT